MTADWKWVNLPGGYAEELVADLCGGDVEGCSPGRGCVVVQTNAQSSFHVSFSNTADLPFRGTDEPVLRFVVGKRRNSMTSVGLGNPYIKKEPIDFTKHADALLTDDEQKSRTYWFLYDASVGIAAMGVQGTPQADLCRLVCRFRDALGFRAEVCENLRYLTVSSGKRPVSLRLVRLCAPPDLSIPRFRFDPVAWQKLPWDGASLVFELDAASRRLAERAQELLRASPIATLYELVEPRCLCVNAYRMLDPHRRRELGVGADDYEGPDWPTCYAEVRRRVEPILRSAAWTYLPLRFEKADCTTISLAAVGAGASAALAAWTEAVHGASGLRNDAMARDLLKVSFAFEVFPVEGENAQQARRDLVREITGLLSKEWGTAELCCPLLACWRTHTEYEPYG